MADISETKLCGNCKKQISANNFVMHEMHCRRHIGLCEHCKEPFPKNEMEAHFQESHAKIKCPKCNIEVEIMHLEDHEENFCAKKPMKCVFCELDFSKCDLNEHLDYCGSRTEPCHKCGAFIMLRDQQKHSELACNKPTPAVTNKHRADAGMSRPISVGGMDNDIGISSYRIGEISQVFGNKGLHAAGAASVGRDFVTRNQVSSKPAKVTNLKTQQKGKGKESDLGSEYDRMLAMQLASDLNTTQDIEGIVEAFGKTQSPDIPAFDGGLLDQYDVNMFTEDAVTIPCEFCGQLCTTDDLVEHQSACSLDRISSVLTQTLGGALNNHRDEPNNSEAAIGANEDVAVYRDIMSPLVQSNVIDNLRDFRHNDWREVADVYAADQEPFADDGETMMLPCEFCDEQFPMDMLIQHQAVCDHNRSVTPAPVTRTQPKSKSSFTNAQRLTAEFPNLKIRQPKPPTSLVHNLDNSDDDSSPVARATRPREPHQVHKPKPSLASNGATGPTRPSGVPPVEVTRAMLKKYGAETTDRGDFYTKKGASSSSIGTSKDSWLKPSNLNTADDPGKRLAGASRTRSTLDNLLHDSREGSAHDLLGHVGAMSRRTEPARQPGTVSTSTRVSSKSRSSVAEGQRRGPLTENSTGTSALGQAKNRAGQPAVEVRVRPSVADQPSDLVTQPRARAKLFASSSKSTTVVTNRKKSDQF